MEMGVDDEGDVGWRDPDLFKTIFEHGRAVGALVLDSVDVLELLVLLVASAGVDEDEARWMLDEQASHTKLYPVPRVRGDALLPERLRNDTEHGAAVEPLPAGLNRMNREAADLAALHQ